ncbi:MAG: hypothetical protein JRI68_14905 [Deltaproteobacteria bacterium]|nr:hypothetical protein [Deltaproteobacteria bacterium]
MLEDLERTWSASMTWEELADFCERMTEKRREIRQSRGIDPPRTRCLKCGTVSRSDISGVSVRSALFALKKTRVVTEAEFKALDKRRRDPLTCRTRSRLRGHWNRRGLV